MLVSIYLSVYNEEDRLPAFLEYHRWCEHFYIAVKKSDDATRELASQHDNVTIIDLPYSPPSEEFKSFKKLILPRIQSEWILNLGVADRVSLRLYETIEKSILRKDCDVLELPYQNIMFGISSPTSPFPNLCYKALLCKTSVADFQSKIHNEIKFTSKKVNRITQTNEAVIHDTIVKTDENFVNKMFLYARTEVMQYTDIGVHNHPYIKRPIYNSLKVLFNGLFRRKTIFDGRHGKFLGLAYVLNHMMIMFVAYYELNRIKKEKSSNG